jgi:hypothetical protein
MIFAFPTNLAYIKMLVLTYWVGFEKMEAAMLFISLCKYLAWPNLVFISTAFDPLIVFSWAFYEGYKAHCLNYISIGINFLGATKIP